MDFHPDKAAVRAAAEPKFVRALGQRRFFGVGAIVRTLYGWYGQYREGRRIRLANSSARQAFRRFRPTLNPEQERLLGQLKTNGIATTRASKLVGKAKWLELQDAANAWLLTADVREREEAYRSGQLLDAKDYLVRMFGLGARIDWSSQWLRFAMIPEVLDLVNSYLGLMARLNSVDVWDTVPRIHDGPDLGSQRWHRDPEATRMLKVFLYLSDVDSASGPMNYVRQSRKGDRYGRLWPQEPPVRGSVPPEGSVERTVPASAVEVCTFSSETLMFVDTSGLHRGGRALLNRRVLAVWTFVPPSSVWPCRFSMDQDSSPEWLSSAARFALLPAGKEICQA